MSFGVVVFVLFYTVSKLFFFPFLQYVNMVLNHVNVHKNHKALLGTGFFSSSLLEVI